MANFDDLFTAPTATETQSDRPQLTKEEYAAKKKAERDSLYALADEMAQEVMRDGEAFRGFLDVQARFDRYSATNALLIYAQNDEATRLRLCSDAISEIDREMQDIYQGNEPQYHA